LTLLSDDNPCKNCPPARSCCVGPKYLKLSQNEYDSYFARFRADGRIIVHKSSEFVVISGLPGMYCPYYIDGCTIYDIRPVECELYPYAMALIISFGNTVFVSLHNFKKNCPKYEQVLIKEGHARNRILDFVRDTYGEGCRIIIWREYSWFNDALSCYWKIKDNLRTLLNPVKERR